MKKEHRSSHTVLLKPWMFEVAKFLVGLLRL